MQLGAQLAIGATEISFDDDVDDDDDDIVHIYEYDNRKFNERSITRAAEKSGLL